MKRNKKIILLCHCILNCNSKVEGCSLYNGAIPEIVKAIADGGIGMLQLPCPELTLYGIRRWGHVKEQFDTPYYRKHCRDLLIPYIEQMRDYVKNGYELVGLLGIDGSPSCGVSATCSGNWGGEFSEHPDLQAALGSVKLIASEGVFIEEAKNLLKTNGIQLPFIGIDEAHMADSIKKIYEFLRRLENGK